MAMPTINPGSLDGLDIENLTLLGLESIDALTGPLIGNKYGYDFTSLKYPDDIEHYFMHGHYINFFINVQRASTYYISGPTEVPGTGDTLPIKLPGVYNYPAGVSAEGGLIGDLFGSGIPTEYNTTDTSYFGPPGDLLYAPTSTQGAMQKLTTQRITQAISLYIPDSMSFGAQIGWDQTSLTEKGAESLYSAIRSAADKMGWGNKLKALATVGEWIKFAGKASGFALNPEILVLYRGIDLRTFQYDFFFSPKNQRESIDIQNIIRAFRFHAAPEVNEDFGLFYIAPSTFDIEFMHRGKRNNCIHQIKTCVLTNYTVDYAPSGWSTHIDGMPIQTRLTLTFQETEILTKQHIAQGF